MGGMVVLLIYLQPSATVYKSLVQCECCTCLSFWFVILHSITELLIAFAAISNYLKSFKCQLLLSITVL